MKDLRITEFKRNIPLEILLEELTNLLAPANKCLIEQFNQPGFPLLLIMGLPRSGTTLFLQWLASLGCFAYPSNLLSRFYGAPAIGAKIQQLLTNPEYDFREELFDLRGQISFESALGKTRGALAPNEFWYFWRRFFPLDVPAPLSQENLDSLKLDDFVAEIAAMEAVFKKPFAMKGLLLDFHIPCLDRLFDNILFVYIRRNHFFNIQSLVESRLKFFGDEYKWYSAKPAEYEWLQYENPYRQVAGQVYYTNKSIEEGLDAVDDYRKLIVDYEIFIQNPANVLEKLLNKYSSRGISLKPERRCLKKFKTSNKRRLPAQKWKLLEDSYQWILNKEALDET